MFNIMFNNMFDSRLFTKGEKRHISKTDRAISRANTQPSSKYNSVRAQIILILSNGGSKSTTSYLLLSMNMVSTSNFEYIHTYIIDHYNPSVRITA